MQHSQMPQAYSQHQVTTDRSFQAGFGRHNIMHTWSAAAFFCSPSQLALSLASSAVSLLSCLLSSDRRAASSAPTSTAACSGNGRMQQVVLSNHSRAPPGTACQPRAAMLHYLLSKHMHMVIWYSLMSIFDAAGLQACYHLSMQAAAWVYGD